MTVRASLTDPQHVKSFERCRISNIRWLLENNAELISVPHRNESFEIVWIKNGSGTLFLDIERYDFESNTVYCISPGKLHHFQTSERIDGWVITFTQDAVGLHHDTVNILHNSGLFNSFKHIAIISVLEQMKSGMEDTLGQIEKEIGNYFPLRSEVLSALIRVFLLYLTRQFDKPPLLNVQSRDSELVDRFVILLDKYYASRKLVLDYANELAVTPKYLNEVVKKVSGFPVSHHIKQRIALEAQRQAKYNFTSMKEVALNLGFEDIAHFSRYFKKVVGMNFTAFKRTVISL